MADLIFFEVNYTANPVPTRQENATEWPPGSRQSFPEAFSGGQGIFLGKYSLSAITGGFVWSCNDIIHDIPALAVSILVGSE